MNNMPVRTDKVFTALGAAFILGGIALTVAYGFTFGNAAALALGALSLCRGMLYRYFPVKAKRVITAFAVAGAVLFLSLAAAIIAGGSRNDAAFDEDFALVLGAGLRNGEVTPVAASRLDRCIDYLRRNPRATVVVSGGVVGGQTVSEASAMSRYLVAKGVEANKIYQEGRSHNTRENMLFSKQLMDSLACGNDYSVVCITSDYHSWRARMLSSDTGLQTSSYPSPLKWYLRPGAYCREVLSVCKYWVNKQWQR